MDRGQVVDIDALVDYAGVERSGRVMIMDLVNDTVIAQPLAAEVTLTEMEELNTDPEAAFCFDIERFTYVGE